LFTHHIILKHLVGEKMKHRKPWKTLLICTLIAFGFLSTSNTILADDYICTGTVGAISIDNLRVPRNAICILDGTQVNGNIQIQAHAKLEASNIYVDGNIQSTEDKVNKILVYNKSYVDGNIQIKNSGEADIRDVWIVGDLQLEYNYQMINAENNVIGGNLQAFHNSGGVTIKSNSIDGNLQCKENVPPPTGGENIVNGNMEDQCKNLFGPAPTPPDDASEPIAIWDWHDLNAVRTDLNGNYRLMRSLDPATAGYGELAGETANDGMGWQPIGSYPDHFTGSFDGQGFELEALFINRPDTDRVGLFGRSGGAIRNIGLVNSTVYGDRWVGALVGVNVGTISDSQATGNIRGSMSVGGLSGTNESKAIVNNSYASGNVDGVNHVGGLVGWNGNQAIVVNSCSSGEVSGEEWRIGGLVGTTYRATISNACAAGNVTGGSAVGALAGSSSSSVVHNSYATGNVTGDTHVGGLVGRNVEGSTLRNSYSTGYVSGNYFVGGLVGLNDSSTVRNSFWNTTTSGTTISSGGTGKTSSELRDIATFTDTGTNGLDSPWDIIQVVRGETNAEYTWNIGEAFPFLSGKNLYNLIISTTDHGSVTVPGEGTSTHDIGTRVDLKATPDKGYQFVSWTGDTDFIANATAGTTTAVIIDGMTIAAHFEKSETDDGNRNTRVSGSNGSSGGGGGCTLNPQSRAGAEWIAMFFFSVMYLIRRLR
jgi:hypothetical protein